VCVSRWIPLKKDWIKGANEADSLHNLVAENRTPEALGLTRKMVRRGVFQLAARFSMLQSRGSGG
jgi:hypothetical protein